MNLRKHPYFDTFRCIAEKCPDSCCQEWDVQVDPEAVRLYQTLPGPLGDRLRQVLIPEEDGSATMTIENRRCPMWRQDGLCRIQAELGHDALCKTCREFPRLTHDYGDFVELGLELSCPEAAQLLLNCPPLAWIEETVPGGEEADYDEADMALLLETRAKALSLLEDLARPLPHTLSLLLLYTYRVQNALDGGGLGEWDPAAELAFGCSVAKPSDPLALLDLYRGLDILTPRWQARLDHPLGDGAWDPRILALARYGVERYWLQAVSDFDLAGRMKALIAGCLLVRLLGGDLVETAQLYAKEVENSIENTEALWDAAYAHPAMTDDKLLGHLLEDLL